MLENKSDSKNVKQIEEALAKLSADQDFVRDLLIAQQKELKDKEVRTDWDGVKKELMEVIDEVKANTSQINSEIYAVKSLVDQIFDVVVELRFKVFI